MRKNGSVSVATETYNLLKDRILNLNYRPGEILVIQQLVNELNISRTPVKEALVRLASDGYLEVFDNRYFRVMNITSKKIMEVFEVRILLECYAVGQLAPVITSEQIAVLEDTLRKGYEAVESHDTMSILDIDNEFHQTLLDMYGNEMMRTIYSQINEKIRVVRHMSLMGRRIYHIMDEHKLIVDALKAHDAKAAEERMQEHFEKVQSNMKNLLEQENGGFIANAVYYNNIK